MSVSSQAHQQPEQSQAVLAIAQKIEQLNEAQFSGSLNCDAVHMARQSLFFVAGRLVWAGGGMHRLRRWRRLLKQVCPEAIFALAQLTPAIPTPTWEYEALRGLLSENHISRDQARQLITLQISEVLFDIVQSWSLAERYEAQADGELKIKDAITLIPAQDLLPGVSAQWDTWVNAGMRLYSPNLSPLLEDPVQLQNQVTASTFTKLKQMLRGQHSLRELASLMGQDVGKLAQALVTYEQQRLLQMRITPDMPGSIPIPSGRAPELPAEGDLGVVVNGQSGSSPAGQQDSPQEADGGLTSAGENPAPVAATSREAKKESLPDTAIKRLRDSGPVSGFFSTKPSTKAISKASGSKIAAKSDFRSALPHSSPARSSNAPLIICIDDHKRVRERIGLILTQQGYRFRGVEDPVQALETIIELRPSLVFVDLLMPTMSGYDICGQIRRVESLQNIPVIILTGTDTILDRMRGKLAGATAYLTKPISPEEILSVVSQQLAAKAS